LWGPSHFVLDFSKIPAATTRWSKEIPAYQAIMSLKKTRSQSFDFWIYSINASVVRM
jgi:hypothetical protein